VERFKIRFLVGIEWAVLGKWRICRFVALVGFLLDGGAG
jgi:hypothetical protein